VKYALPKQFYNRKDQLISPNFILLHKTKISQSFIWLYETALTFDQGLSVPLREVVEETVVAAWLAVLAALLLVLSVRLHAGVALICRQVDHLLRVQGVAQSVHKLRHRALHKLRLAAKHKEKAE
jgi:phage FluMu protein gp41